MQEAPGDKSWQHGTGDMSADEFRRFGHQAVDWIASYLENLEDRPVLSTVAPGSIRRALPAAAPAAAESMDDILRDFEQIVMPGITHWNHPSFFAYFAITGSGPGILGELLSAALNINAMLWRTSPSATELETTTLEWLRQMVGLPEGFEGVIYDTASISTLVAIAAARQATGLPVREGGLSGHPSVPVLRLYCSEHAHSSVEKGAITLGVGQNNVRKIPSDERYQMDPAALRAAIEEDFGRGMRPFCVVATVGTTSTTSIDPVPDIAKICEEYRIWLHVDAAYAGVAAILPEMRWVLDGVERADSVVINPHKWLFTPVDLSAFFSRRLSVVSEAFSLVPAYLQTDDGLDARNYMNYGPQLGRRFRALKLWFVLRAFGREGIERRLREHIRLAQLFVAMVDGNRDWELLAPAPFSTVCFRANPGNMSDSELNDLNQRIETKVNATGEAFLAHTVLGDRLTLRLAVGNLRTEERHITGVWELLQGALADSVNE